jgi:hypothetical protein
VQRRSVDGLAGRAHDALLELTRATRFDELAAERAQQRLCDGRESQLPHAGELANRAADQWIVPEAAQKLRVVRINRDHEAQALQPFLALCPQHDASVDELMRGAEFDPFADPQRCRQDAVTDVTRRVARMPDALCKRVRPRRADDSLEG